MSDAAGPIVTNESWNAVAFAALTPSDLLLSGMLRRERWESGCPIAAIRNRYPPYRRGRRKVAAELRRLADRAASERLLRRPNAAERRRLRRAGAAANGGSR